jgi:hypothetical protein
MIFIFYFSLKMSVGASTVPGTVSDDYVLPLHYRSSTLTIFSRSKHILRENFDPDPGL